MFTASPRFLRLLCKESYSVSNSLKQLKEFHMSVYITRRALITGVAALVLGVFSVESAEKDIKVTIEKVTVEDMVYTPYYRVDTEQDHQRGSASRWIRLGVYFKTEGGWIDELSITQMALKPDKETGEDVVLTEKVHYINLDPGDHAVYVYLHPSYVTRYEISDYDLEVAAVIKLNGKEMARKETSRQSEPGWSSSTDLIKRKGYLLNHMETPFWFINYDFKEVIKMK